MTDTATPEVQINANLPSDPAHRKIITDAIKEMGDSFTREDAEKTLRKAIQDSVKEKTKVPAELLQKWAKWAHYEGTRAKEVNRVLDQEQAFTILFPKAAQVV